LHCARKPKQTKHQGDEKSPYCATRRTTHPIPDWWTHRFELNQWIHKSAFGVPCLVPSGRVLKKYRQSVKANLFP